MYFYELSYSVHTMWVVCELRFMVLYIGVGNGGAGGASGPPMFGLGGPGPPAFSVFASCFSRYIEKLVRLVYRSCHSIF